MNSQAFSKRNRNRLVLCIYLAALLYYVLKLIYYAACMKGFPDQMAQLSYLVEMARRPSVFPDFASIPMYRKNGIDGFIQTLKLSKGSVNYLGHPPLYYLLMNLTGAVNLVSEKKVTVDLLRLGVFNGVLSAGTIALALYLGYTRLKERSPWIHALYASAVVTLPMLAYVGASVNNDNLAFLALVIFFAGMVRYQEDRLNLGTYLLLGAGFLLGSFSKLTTALLMLLMLLTALAVSVVRTKSLKLVLNKYFLITLPVYILFLVYEIKIKKTYGVWQPSLANFSPEKYYASVFYVQPEDRIAITFPQFLVRFLRQIGYTWSSLYGHNTRINDIMRNNAFGIVYWVPVAVTALAAVRGMLNRTEPRDRIALPAAVAFFGTLAYHLMTRWKAYPSSGYLGGLQARYYLAMIVPFAFIMCRELPDLFRTPKAKRIGSVLAVLLILCWIAGDGIRLLLTVGFTL